MDTSLSSPSSPHLSSTRHSSDSSVVSNMVVVHDDNESIKSYKLDDNDIEQQNHQHPAPLYPTETEQEEDFIVRVLTRGLSGKSSSNPSPMGLGKDYPPLLNIDREKYRVDFNGPDDPLHPFNWPLRKKLQIFFALGITTFSVTWGSAGYGPAVQQIKEEFHVGLVVGLLGISVFVLGFASGPVIWAPISELYGRKLPTLISAFGYILFSFASATSKDIQTLIITRFFAGFLGAAPWAVVAAALSDMFNNHQRGTAVTAFMCIAFTGPVIAPVVGGFIANSYLHWRWTEYITGILAVVAFLADVLLMDETYHPLILARKAQQLRLYTGNWAIYAAHEQATINLSEIITKNLTRPLRMLFIESILLLITIYTAFVYGILYLFLEAYPIVFRGYGFKGGIVYLPYIGVFIGILIAALANIFIFEKRYDRGLVANGKQTPKARLPGMMTGGIVFPIGLFWFAWTGSYPQHIHWIVPTLSGIFTGFGLFSVFPPAINYLVDIYLPFAASAIAGTTFLRSSFGAVFPLFATPMYENMGIQWAGTLVACVSLLLAPVPFLFYIYGDKIAARSKFAVGGSI